MRPDVTVIGFAGLKGSGKDFTATAVRSYIAETNPGAVVVQLAFAAPVKRLLSLLTGLPLSLFYDKKDKVVCPVITAQRIATAISTVYLLSDHPEEDWVSCFNVFAADMQGKELTIRELMQQFGTEYVQNYVCKEAWADMLAKHIEGMVDGTIILVTDLRFAHEAEVVRFDNIYLIESELADPSDGHASEQPLEWLQNVDYAKFVNSKLPKGSDHVDLMDHVSHLAEEVLVLAGVEG